jgi:hypothetical protein
MAVLINELEVIVEPPPAAAEPQPATAAAPPSTPPALSPDDIGAIVSWQAERASRVYAG